MANVDRPFGFTPIGTSDGADYHGKLREVEFLDTDATAAYVGDMVALTGTTGADGLTPVVTRAAAGASIIGAIVSFEPTFEDEGSLTLNYREASTARKAKVCFGSEVLYSVQTSNGTIAAGDFGQNIDLAAGAGNNITGISGMTVDVGTVVGATAQFRLRHIERAIDNELGEFARVIVNVNENQDDNGTGV